MEREAAVLLLWEDTQLCIHDRAATEDSAREWERETMEALLALGCTAEEAMSGAHRLRAEARARQ